MDFPNSPLVLSIESSAVTCGVALSAGTTLLAETSCFVRHAHDRLLARYCRDILQQFDLAVDRLSAVAVSAGPGSFTGLRIGAAIAKALCYDDTPRLIAVPTLRALAFAAVEFAVLTGADEITAVVASHKDLLYVQSFTPAEAIPTSAIRLVQTADLAQQLRQTSVYCGPPAAELKTPLRLSGLNRLTPRFTARLAAHLYDQGEFTPASAFVPLYVQEFVPRTTHG